MSHSRLYSDTQILYIYPNQIIEFKFNSLAVPINLNYLNLLGFIYIIAAASQNIVYTVPNTFGFSYLLALTSVNKKYTEVVDKAYYRIEDFIREKEGYLDGSGVQVVIGGLGYRKNLILIILVLVNERLQILLQLLVRVLTLAVSLEMIDGGKITANILDLIQVGLNI